jgi:hypothetical protein
VETGSLSCCGRLISTRSGTSAGLFVGTPGHVDRAVRGRAGAGLARQALRGRLAEATGRRIPVVALPFVNQALAANTVYAESLARLRRDGVRDPGGVPYR